MENNKKSNWSGRKVFTVVLSVLLAAALWIFVDNQDSAYGSEKTKVISDIPIEYLGEDTTLADRGLMLMPDSDQSVTMEIRARRWVLAKLDPDKIRIQANLSDITATGSHSVSYTVVYPSVSDTYTSAFFRQNVTVINASSFNAQVEIGELYSREVDIRCALEGNVAEGYIAGELQFQPGALELRGVQEEVDQVAYAKVTLSVENATETVTQTLDYLLYDENDQVIQDTGNLHATADQIQVTLPVNVEKELPLQINFVESAGAKVGNLEYAISPASITVSGSAEILKDVDAITLDDFELADFNGPTTYRYSITVPAGCENLSGATRATMTIKFKDIATTTVNAVNFTCENVPDGKTVTVLTTELPVTLRGTAADTASVTAEDVTVVADLTDVTGASGSYTVPAKIIVSNGVDVGVRGDYQVRITITEGTGEPETDVPVEPDTPTANTEP